MEKEIRIINESRGMVCVTMASERFYLRLEKDKEGLPAVIARPSSTWIASYYYTSPYLIKWIADKGMTESERIRDAAGVKGSRVHKAIDMWLDDVEIKIDTKIPNEDTGREEELTVEENECFKSFIEFYKKVKPEIVAHNYTVWGEKYAGTVDVLCKIDGELGILDVKSGQTVVREHELQVSSYKHASEKPEEIKKLWILQVGYKKNKVRWKLTEVEDKFKLFLNAYDTWEEENTNATPKYIEYPTVYSTKKELDALELPKKEAKVETD